MRSEVKGFWDWGAATAWARSITSPRQFPDLLPGRPAQCGVMAPGRRQSADPTANVASSPNSRQRTGRGKEENAVEMISAQDS